MITFRMFIEWEMNPQSGLPMAAGVLPISKATGRLLPNMRSAAVGAGRSAGQFSTWGGALDEGETPQQAAIRELKEEAGYSGPMQLIPGFVFRNDKYEYHNFIGIVPNEFNASTNWESGTTNWITLEELLQSKAKYHPAFAQFVTSSMAAIQSHAR